MKAILVIAVLVIGLTGCNSEEAAVKEQIAAKHAEQVNKFKEYDESSFQ